MEKAQPKLYAKTYKFPGKWMPEGELGQIRKQLISLGRRALGEVPAYGVYLPSRAPYKNRIITVVYKKEDHRPIAFSAMVVWPVQLPGQLKFQSVVHLGLVVVDPEYRGSKVMYWAYHRPLFRYFARRLFRPFWITSTTMEPVIVGSVADGFSHVFPHYRPDQQKQPSSAHLEIARTFVAKHGHEIGVWKDAWLDENNFVIRDSSLGASQHLMHSYEQTAKYRLNDCNEFCRKQLNYERGDEFIQVGRVDLPALWVSAWWFIRKLKKYFGIN